MPSVQFGSVFAVQRSFTPAHHDAAVHEAGNGQLQSFVAPDNLGPERPVLPRLLPFARHPQAPAIVSSERPESKKGIPVVERSPRKLAVILHADVVGSTALVQRDEALAHERIRDVFHRFSATIESYNGHPLELRGDALVGEFSRASDAVSAALAFQIANEDHNKGVTDDIRPEIRIGISLGEVVIADGTITGAGVVLAQRLEQLAEPGGICIQGAAYETVPERLPFNYESLGEQTVKGFEEPVRVYTVRLEDGQAIPPPDPTVRPDKPALELPDKPSIAVLPFTNMSGDPEQEYFSDGITEDIITELSRFRDLSVIARNSSFVFKGKSVAISEVGSKLGVQYVVEGSVRKAGNRVRITAQLVNVATGDHIWADRYDRQPEDIFDVQDEVVRTVTATLIGRVERVRRDRAKYKPTSNLKAYECLLRGREHFFRLTPADHPMAKEMFEKAITLDPDYAAAYVGLAETHFQEWHAGWSEAPDRSFAAFCESAEKSVALDDTDSRTLAVLGMAYLFRREFDQAHAHLNRAVRLNPIDTRTLARMSRYDMLIGEPERAIQRVNEASRIDPFGKFGWYLGQSNYAARRYDESISAFKSVRDPVALVRAWIAASYAQAGRETEAKQATQECVLATEVEFGVRAESHNWLEFLVARWPFKHEEDSEHLREGLRKAGLG
jgi:adenylate cyclase